MRYHRIPLEFLTNPEWDEFTDSPAIDYEVRPYQPSNGRTAQPILAGRDVLTPRLDLNDYACSAVIDWLEIDLVTPGTHQALNMHRYAADLLRKLGAKSTVFITGPGRKTPYTGQQFTLRLQDPHPNVLWPFLQGLNSHYAPARRHMRDTRIVGIEISIDFRVRGAEALSKDRRNLLRWRIVDALRRHVRPDAALTEAPGCAPRFFMSRGGKDHAQYLVDSHAAVPKGMTGEMHRLGLQPGTARILGMKAHHRGPVDTTTYIGGAEFPVMLRIMDKRTDIRDPGIGTAHALEEANWRGRIEVSLPETRNWESAAAPLGLQTVQDLYGFDHLSIRRLFFEFFLPTVDPGDAFALLPVAVPFDELDVFDRSGVYGLDRLHRALFDIQTARYRSDEISQRPLSLGKKGRLVSYLELNQKVDRALRKLSKDWKTPTHRISSRRGAGGKRPP